MVQVCIEQQESWYRDDQLGYARGWAFQGETLLKGKSLLKYLDDAFRSGQTAFGQALQALNGFFSIILTSSDAVLLIADKVKSYPLLYSREGNTFIVSNQGEVLHKRMKNIRINEAFVPTFLALGYLWGEHTLYEHSFIVPASTYVLIKEGVSRSIFYGKSRALCSERTKEDIFRQADVALEHAFERFVRMAGNRTIVLPLSGGYDSRLLACLCKKFGLQNVMCYTYGIKGNPETDISRQIARQLGFPWHYVEYTTEKWKQVIWNGLVETYLRFAGNLNAIAHLQDFLAIQELQSLGVIPEESIIVPGHTGDVLGGSHLPMEPLDFSNLPLLLYEKYYELNVLKPNYRTQALELLRNSLPKGLTSEEDCLQAFYDWGKDARQSNFIINSVRAYEFMGWKWAVPLWDDEYARFWESVPCGWRKGSALYNRFLFRYYFAPFQVGLRKPYSVPPLSHRLLVRFLNHDERSIVKNCLEKYHLKRIRLDDYALDDVGELLNRQSPFLERSADPYVRMIRRGSMSRKALLYLSMIR